VPLTTEASQSADFSFDEVNLVTAMALLNPSSQQIVATITVYGSDGSQTATTQISLEPHSKIASIVRDLPGLSGMTGTRGRIQIEVPNGTISILGLRFGGEAFTSIPVTHK